MAYPNPQSWNPDCTSAHPHAGPCPVPFQPYRPTDLRQQQVDQYPPQSVEQIVKADPRYQPSDATQAATEYAARQTASQSAPEPTQSDPYALGAWGTALQDFTCPSGQRCALRKVDITDLMKAGMLDQINTLAGIADDHIQKASGLPPIDTAALIRDPDKLATLSRLMDKVVVMAVARPTILPAVTESGEKIPLDQREQGVGYTDFISFTDKMAIFHQVVGGLSQMEPFRAGPAEPGKSVANEPGAAQSAQRATRDQ